VSLEREIFPALAKEGKLWGFPFSGYWFDIGSIRDYRKANFSLLQDSASESKPEARNAMIAADAAIREPVSLADNSRVDGRAHVGPNVLIGKNGYIARNARVAHSILFDGVSVGEDSEVNGAILGTGVKVGKKVRIGRECIISPHVAIADRVRIGAGAIIHPYKEITRNVRAATHVM
jgi:mannose-1-phosphate guanylyltransferase/phosphomannomutase